MHKVTPELIEAILRANVIRIIDAGGNSFETLADNIYLLMSDESITAINNTPDVRANLETYLEFTGVLRK